MPADIVIAAAATILILLAIIVSVVDYLRHKDEKPPDTEETSIVSDLIEDSSVHLLLICVIGGGLAYVKHADELKLKEKNSTTIDPYLRLAKSNMIREIYEQPFMRFVNL